MTQTAAPVSAAEAQVERVFARLSSSFRAGATRPLGWRKAQLKALETMLTEREQELQAALHADLGKPAVEAWMTELGHVASEVRHILGNLDAWAAPRKVPVRPVLRPARARVVPEPLGVALVIAPWNYPVHLLLLPMAYALAAGNAVVAKPSEVSAATSQTLDRLLPEYLDEDAVAVVEGGPEVVGCLLEQRFDHIFYTGNGRVGRIVMAAAAKNLTPVTLELGGKSPAIVDRRAKLEVAAQRIAWGKFLNAGQTCVAPDYVLVDRSVEEPFLAALKAAVRRFYGPHPESSPDYGRIVNERHWDRLQALLSSRKSGTVVLGGEGDRSRRYLAPTLIAGVSWDDPLMQEEIFGPILPVLAVEDYEEAIEAVNSRDKPLALYVFSEDRPVLDKVVERTSSGGVCTNATLFHLAEPRLPFGGVGESGIGAYHGRAGFECFSHDKAVMDRSTRVDPALSYPPYTGLKRWVLRRAF